MPRSSFIGRAEPPTDGGGGDGAVTVTFVMLVQELSLVSFSPGTGEATAVI